MSMFRQVTIPQRSGQKGVRAEGTVPVTQFGHISEQEYDCHRY